MSLTMYGANIVVTCDACGSGCSFAWYIDLPPGWVDTAVGERCPSCSGKPAHRTHRTQSG